jgi:hypothetical protein
MGVLWSRRALVTFFAAFAVAACDVNVSNGEFNVGLASGRATDEWTREYAIAAGGRLTVKNVNGTITLESAGAGGKTRVRAERIARATSDESAKELLQKITIDESVTPDVVRLETRAPSGWRSGQHEVKYFVAVPPGVMVEARTTNGGVTMVGLANEVDVSTVNGGIKGERLSGPVQARTTNGGVHVRMDGMTRDGVRLSTVNGGVSLELPGNARADISAHATNGGIHTDNLDLTVRDQSHRRLDATLNGGGGHVELSATNGGIRLSGR